MFYKPQSDFTSFLDIENQGIHQNGYWITPKEFM